jgi:antirestriction protein ArdC
MRTFTVFCSDQVEGADKLITKPVIKNPVEIHEEAERVIKCYMEAEKIPLKVSNRAAYSPSLDAVMMPSRDTFIGGTNSYYGTFLHELALSTGAEKRLNRLDKLARFGSESYAIEELIAEMAGCYLLGAVGLPILDKLENHASYLEAWLKVLKQDKKAIFQASTQASAASDYVLKPSRPIEVEEEELVAC